MSSPLSTQALPQLFLHPSRLLASVDGSAKLLAVSMSSANPISGKSRGCTFPYSCTGGCERDGRSGENGRKEDGYLPKGWLTSFLKGQIEIHSTRLSSRGTMLTTPPSSAPLMNRISDCHVTRIDSRLRAQLVFASVCDNIVRFYSYRVHVHETIYPAISCYFMINFSLTIMRPALFVDDETTIFLISPLCILS